MRLFIAVELPDSVKAELESVCSQLKAAVPDARWTRPEGRHLTLKFLGECDDTLVDPIEAGIEMASSQHGPVTTTLTTVGGFPNVGRPRVLWVGIDDPDDVLAALAEDIAETVQPLGFERERRKFAAHITLARFKEPAAIGDLPRVGLSSDEFELDEVVLYESQLRRDGAVYTALRRFPLTG